MQANADTFASRLTVTEAARRAQIVDATIRTIAEHGFASASYARIAKRAGISSTGLISYHFASKHDLLAEVATGIIRDIGQHMHVLMQSASTPTEALTIYIEGTVGFMRDHPERMRALLDIFMNGGLSWDGASEQSALSGIERILIWGQETGEFRDFDIRVMATTIQRSIDGIPFVQQTDPALDLDAWADEIVSLFTLATVRQV